MHTALPPSIIAEAVLIMAWRCLVFCAPAIAVGLLWWLTFRTDRIIHYLFPDLEWEHSLGWVNIRAEKRANWALRCLDFAIYLLLGGALYGIAWAAVGLQALVDGVVDPLEALLAYDLGLRIAVLLLSLGAWLLYLGSWLIPKIRRDREEAALKVFRAKMAEEELERERNPRSRVKSPLPKPRVNAALELPKTPEPFGNRDRYWRQPGG
jgi:hypothetical protein